MDERLRGQLKDLEDMASLGALVSSFTHELNNHLAAAVLASESARVEGSAASFEQLDKQLKNVAELSSLMRHLRADNVSGRSKEAHLSDLVARLVEWIQLGGSQAELVLSVTGGDVAVLATESSLLLALHLLVRSFPEGEGRMLRFGVGSEEVLRSKWSDDGEFVKMGKLVIECRGVQGTGWPEFELSDLVNRFYERPASPRERRVMAAWEIIRKVSGRPSPRLSFENCPREESLRVVLWLPVAVDCS